MKAVAAERRLPALGLPSLRFAGLVAAAPLLLALARLLPTEGVGLGLRLAAAAACLLVLPGGLVVAAIGRPPGLGAAAAAALAWSLTIAFLAFAVTFAVGGSLSLALLVVAAAAVAALVPALRATPVGIARSDLGAAGSVVFGGIVFGVVAWWAAGPIDGDGLFHLARARKLAELDVLRSIETVSEFRDGGLHPGYAFPLWHGVLALVAELAGVDVADVVRYLPAALAPLAFLVAYGAGASLFGSWAGGAATLAAYVASFGFARGAVGSFEFLSLPATASALLLVPAVLALAFAFVRSPARTTLLSLALAAFAVAVVHPTYALFVAVPLGGFLVARLLLAPGDRRGTAAIAASVAAVLVPFGLFALWLLPVVRATASHTPGAGERSRGVEHYSAYLDVSGDSFRMAPDAISRGGGPAVAALLAVPLAGLAARRLWTALVLGGYLAVLAVLLVPPVFTAFADLVSLSQARRLAIFLPLPFALAGAAFLLGRLKLAGVVLALAAGVLLQLLYPGDFEYEPREGGPGWTVWVAAAGGLVALAAGALLRRSLTRQAAPLWAALASLAFAAPVAASGLANLSPERPDPRTLAPGVVHALRAEAEPGDVVFADLEASYRIAAYAPVYVAAAPPSHVADTEENRPYERRADVVRFFYRRGVADSDRLGILREYQADWVLVDKSRRYPESLVRSLRRVYEDGRYALFRVARG